jgi:hypothetical protein
MKFTVEMLINKSRKDVWKAFDNVDNMKKWQPGLVSFEGQSGTPGQVGAVSKLTYEEDGRTIELIETITHRNEPSEFDGTYGGRGVENIIRNRFHEAGPGQTRWVMECEFKFNGLMALMMPLMKAQFVKRTQTDMERFKQVAESQ